VLALCGRILMRDAQEQALDARMIVWGLSAIAAHRHVSVRILFVAMRAFELRIRESIEARWGPREVAELERLAWDWHLEYTVKDLKGREVP
jgi:hypothetical protein